MWWPSEGPIRFPWKQMRLSQNLAWLAWTMGTQGDCPGDCRCRCADVTSWYPSAPMSARIWGSTEFHVACSWGASRDWETHEEGRPARCPRCRMGHTGRAQEQPGSTGKRTCRSTSRWPSRDGTRTSDDVTCSGEASQAWAFQTGTGSGSLHEPAGCWSSTWNTTGSARTCRRRCPARWPVSEDRSDTAAPTISSSATGSWGL